MKLQQYLILVSIVTSLVCCATINVAAYEYEVQFGDWKYGAEGITDNGHVIHSWTNQRTEYTPSYLNKDVLGDDSGERGTNVMYFEIGDSLDEGSMTKYELGTNPWNYDTTGSSQGTAFYQTWGQWTATIGGYLYTFAPVFTSNHFNENGAFSWNLKYKSADPSAKYWRITTYFDINVDGTSNKVEMWDLINQSPADHWDNIYAELTVGDKGHRDSTNYTSGNGEEYGFIRINAQSDSEDILLSDRYSTADNWYWTIQNEQHADPKNPVWANTGENDWDSNVGVWVQSVKYTTDMYTSGTGTMIIGKAFNY